MLRRRWISLLIILGVLALAPFGYADSIGVGDWIKLYDAGIGTTNGGEFDVYKSNGGKTGSYSDQGFNSFCLETNEYFRYGEPLYVAGITKNAESGGSGGPDPDPLDQKTAYLYYHFRIGDLGVLTSNQYTYGTDAGANALQRAIWYIEEEGGTSNYLVTLANSATSDALALAYAHVFVLNLTDGNGGKRQDQLVLVPVPEPGTMLLLGFGLIGLAIGIRRRK